MEENNRNTKVSDANKANSAMRAAFGIIMVLIYLAIGILLCTNNFFGAISNHTISLIVGIVLMVYGVWRGYRLWRNWP